METPDQDAHPLESPQTDTSSNFPSTPASQIEIPPVLEPNSNLNQEMPINHHPQKIVIFIILALTLFIITCIGLSIYIFKNKNTNEVSMPYNQTSNPSTFQDSDTSIEHNNTQPYAWMGEGYVSKIGQPITFDASGSYDPPQNSILLYEWDFDGDGVFDFVAKTPTATHTYHSEFNDYVTLRVTGANGTAMAHARTVVNEQGYASQGDEDPCELDENGYSIITGPDGNFLYCTADHLPTQDKEGVFIVAQ